MGWMDCVGMGSVGVAAVVVEETVKVEDVDVVLVVRLVDVDVDLTKAKVEVDAVLIFVVVVTRFVVVDMSIGIALVLGEEIGCGRINRPLVLGRTIAGSAQREIH